MKDSHQGHFGGSKESFGEWEPCLASHGLDIRDIDTMYCPVELTHSPSGGLTQGTVSSCSSRLFA